jgi:putative iron-dependent peroxidase
LDTNLAQPGILAPLPALRRSLTFGLRPGITPTPALRRFAAEFTPDWGVVGCGEPLLLSLGCRLDGLRTFPALAGPGIAVPSTQGSLWVALGADDRGMLFERARHICAGLDTAFTLVDAVDAFLYAGGRDLTGYEDGTENPKGEAAVVAALVAAGSGRAGSSFVAVQRWRHDLAQFEEFPRERRDSIIGRRLDSNEEIDDAPSSAHVKRTAQESFAPPAFVVRRSLPWDDGFARGLEFVAYGASLDYFEAQLRRMAGLDDGIADALFAFSRPVSGAYYWCPPLAAGRLDLRLLGLPAA